MKYLILLALVSPSVFACTDAKIDEIKDVCFESTNDELELKCLERELKKQCGIECRIDTTVKKKIFCQKPKDV